MSLMPNNDPNAGILASPTALAAADDLLGLGLEPIADIDDDDDPNSVSVLIIRAAPGLGSLSLQRYALSLTIPSTLHPQAILNSLLLCRRWEWNSLLLCRPEASERGRLEGAGARCRGEICSQSFEVESATAEKS